MYLLGTIWTIKFVKSFHVIFKILLKPVKNALLPALLSQSSLFFSDWKFSEDNFDKPALSKKKHVRFLTQNDS